MKGGFRERSEPTNAMFMSMRKMGPWSRWAATFPPSWDCERWTMLWSGLLLVLPSGT